MRITMLMAVGLAALLATPALADHHADEDKAVLSRGYRMKVKQGHSAEFESGMKQQVAWYRDNDETWHWHTWQYLTGPHTGEYMFRSPGHTWKDMDDRQERSQRARKHFDRVAGTHVESMHGSISASLRKISHWPEDYGEVAMVSVISYRLHYGMSDRFEHAMKRIHEAIQESDWPVHYAWGTVVSGGEMPGYWLVLPRRNYADMAPPEMPFRKMLEETLGREAADAIRADLMKCVKSVESSLLRFREDLSYMPEE